MSKHTPGPWDTRESATHVTVTNAHGDAVFHDDKRIPGVMADASLIAAAPELLEALKLALEYWRHRQQRYKNRSPVWVQAARAAITKATGEQA